MNRIRSSSTIEENLAPLRLMSHFALTGYSATNQSTLRDVSVDYARRPSSSQLSRSGSSISNKMNALKTSNSRARVISAASMQQFQAEQQTEKLSASKNLTPLDSLKELISKKQASPKRTFVCMSGQARVASVFEKPSDELMHVLQQHYSESALKRRKTNPDALHDACRRGPSLSVEQVEEFIKNDPSAPCRPLRLNTTKRIYDRVSNNVVDKTLPEKYMYPLNLAISYGASSQVLERLASAAPAVLTMRDGNLNGGRSFATSLHALLRHWPRDIASADMILLMNPATASAIDGQQNTALHIAIQNGASLEIIRHLVVLNPAALNQRNFQGRTPLELAQTYSMLCSAEVAEYLRKTVQSQY